jgi:exodeoxyribonuclease-3
MTFYINILDNIFIKSIKNIKSIKRFKLIILIIIMKIIAWNVNGIRSLLKTNYLNDMLKEHDPDIFCMGETKLSCPYDNIENEIAKIFPQFKFRYWSPCKTRNGYSGTAIFCKKKPKLIIYGLKYKNKEIDDEGRMITIELEKFYLIHVYTPNSGQALNRLEWRTTVWDRAFENKINNLQKIKPVIVCGDLNVAHKLIDLKNPKTNTKTAGFTKEEKESFNKILTDCNLIDTYRKLYPEKIEYSFWSYMKNSRKKNIGWRIDYFLVSQTLQDFVDDSSILTTVMGSDHAPIKIKLNKIK